MYSYRLQVFHAVARYRSYSRAAREVLHISQPAVSKHVQALEADVGVPLVQRVGKRVDLTEAGRLVQQYAEQMLALGEETRRAVLDLQGVQRGTLRLGATSTPGFYLLPPVLAAFTQAYPGITLAVEIANSGQVVAGVLQRAWDLGVVSGTPAEAPLHVQPYCRDTLVLIVPPTHRLAAQPTVTLADLVGETWILRAAGSPSGQEVERALQAHHALHGHILRLQGSAAVKQAVMAGLGIAMVSRYAITPEVQHGFLRALAVADLQVERELSLIWRHGVRLPAAAIAFLDLLRATGGHGPAAS